MQNSSENLLDLALNIFKILFRWVYWWSQIVSRIFEEAVNRTVTQTRDIKLKNIYNHAFSFPAKSRAFGSAHMLPIYHQLVVTGFKPWHLAKLKFNTNEKLAVLRNTVYCTVQVLSTFIVLYKHKFLNNITRSLGHVNERVSNIWLIVIRLYLWNYCLLKILWATLLLMSNLSLTISSCIKNNLFTLKCRYVVRKLFKILMKFILKYEILFWNLIDFVWFWMLFLRMNTCL